LGSASSRSVSATQHAYRSVERYWRDSCTEVIVVVGGILALWQMWRLDPNRDFLDTGWSFIS
jgi:hypothetical protein